MIASRGHLRIVVWNNAGLQVLRIFRPSGHGFSMRAGANFSCGWVRIFCVDVYRSSMQIRVEMVETRRRTSCTTIMKDRETRRKDCSKYHMSRTYLDMKYER